MNADASQFRTVWSGATSYVLGSIAYSGPVQVGDWYYSGDILEIIVWKGAALTQAEVSSLQTYFETKYWCTCSCSCPLLSGCCVPSLSLTPFRPLLSGLAFAN
jgi:hypothetical protein